MSGAGRPLQGRVADALRAGLRGPRLLVAASGGLDSTVLVHVLDGLRGDLEIDLALGHVNHGLRSAESEADARFVETLAGAVGAPFGLERVEPEALRTGTSSRERATVQEAARILRREALERLADRLGCDHVVTAHHADDQLETVLLRLLRGCGPDSLGGIGETARGGRVLRPLLGVGRAEIEAWAATHGVVWREDRSNADPRYARNRLRHQVLPRLEKDFNPQLLRAVADLAEAQRRDTEWLESLVREEAARLVTRDPQGGLRIDAAGWSSRPEALSRRLMRWMLVEMDAGRDVRRVHLERMLAFLRVGRVGAAIELPAGLRLERENADSFLLFRASHSR